MASNWRKKGRKLISQLHLWLGLISGLIVFVVSLTGAIYVYQVDINHWLYPNRYEVAAATVPDNPQVILPYAQLKKTAEKAMQAPVSYGYVYTDGQRNAWFMAIKVDQPEALWFFDSYAYFKQAYINPYTGQVTDVVDMKQDFFSVIKYLHWSLLLNTQYGQPIVGWATVIFLILLITGVVLWWPKWKNKKSVQNAFKIDFRAKWKRLNFQLHNVLGFYSLILTIIVVVTGLFYSFKIVPKLLYVVAAGTTEQPVYITKKSDTTAQAELTPIDIALQRAQKAEPECTRFMVNQANTSKETPLFISAYLKDEVYYDRVDFQFDQYTGELLHKQTTADMNAGQQLIGMNYDIHVGSIGGWWGKLLAFIIALISTSLPVTGFLYWWYRKKFLKKKKKKKQKSLA